MGRKVSFTKQIAQLTAPSVRASVAAPLYVRQGRNRYAVASLAEAAAKWCAFRDESGAGVSEIGNGVTVTDAHGAVVGRVSYNGRIWAGA